MSGPDTSGDRNYLGQAQDRGGAGVRAAAARQRHGLPRDSRGSRAGLAIIAPSGGDCRQALAIGYGFAYMNAALAYTRTPRQPVHSTALRRVGLDKIFSTPDDIIMMETHRSHSPQMKPAESLVTAVLLSGDHWHHAESGN